MKYSLVFLATLVLLGCKSEKTKVEYINPIIGAVTYDEKNDDMHGFGKTFPGPVTPYGLIQLSPDTRSFGDNGSGYSWNHTTIEGFSFTHMSGVGAYGDLGNFLVMPATGKLYTNRGIDSLPEKGYRSRISKEDEIAKAGYYSIVLSDYDIRAELAAAPRAGIIKFTFPENDSSRIQIDLSRRIGGTSVEQYVKLEDEQTISGWMKCTPQGGGWMFGYGNVNYTAYFYAQFSKPIKDYGVWHADVPTDTVRNLDLVATEPYQNIVANATVEKNVDEFRGNHIGFFTNFSTMKKEEIYVKAGISFISVEGAKLNLESDIPDWNFNSVVNQTRSAWDEACENVTVEGGTDREKEIFYTALYHTMIDPRTFSDANGQYVGADNRIHETKDFTYRSIFSGWDVFRSQFPLQTIINPEMVNDEINSLLEMARLSGKEYLPRWELLNAYTNCMIGNPAVSVIVDAYRKGIRNYDIDKAFTYCKNTVDSFGNEPLGYTPNSISHTLEYAYTDWCMGRFAESLNKPVLANKYYQRSMNYKNIWNDEVNWFRARDEHGDWMKWKGKLVHGQGCVESNPNQQGWFVPHDIDGLTRLMGGTDSIQQILTDFFEQTPDHFLWNDYYNHPNEPVHHVPFMFNEIGLPKQTQKWTRKICEMAYDNDAYGLCGNEDVGQMSAWYVLAAMGLHPINPGDNKYQITSPVFNKITIKLDNKYYSGDTFTVIAENNSPENIYIQSIKLNGKPLDRYWITHEEIVTGGVLELEMGAN
ncbi:MAG: glycoside hydrolase family 92 protein [Bacteroidetes bacterium]|jgi:predicted alpha-1,2-mannosidase|nr:glycoside hydrolase family 92 protein [Bacteroidota bacterium]